MAISLKSMMAKRINDDDDDDDDGNASASLQDYCDEDGDKD